MRVVFALAFAVAAAGCTISGDYTGTHYTCDEGRCPPGFRCVDGKCIDHDAGHEPDDAAPALDAMDDAFVCAHEPRSDSCMAADLEDLTDVTRPGGQTVCGTTAGLANDLLGCPGALPGLDAVFRFSATAGQQITATLQPIGFDGALYLLTDCSGQCLDGVANAVGVGGTETQTVTATVSGNHYVVVDSPSGAGPYELTVAVE